MKVFNHILEDDQSTKSDISMAIRGQGKFARAIVEFLGVWELKKMFTKLLTLSNKFSAK